MKKSTKTALTIIAAGALLSLASCARKPIIPAGDGTDIFKGKTISTSFGQGMSLIYEFDEKGNMVEKSTSQMQDAVIATYKYSYSESEKKLYLEAKKYVFEGKEYSKDAALNFISGKAYEKFVTDIAKKNNVPEDLIPDVIENYRNQENVTIETLFAGAKEFSVTELAPSKWTLTQLESDITFPEFFKICGGYFTDNSGLFIAGNTFYMYNNPIKLSNLTESAFLLLPPNSTDEAQGIHAEYTVSGSNQDDLALDISMTYLDETSDFHFDYQKKELDFVEGTPASVSIPGLPEGVEIVPQEAESAE